MSKIYTRDEVAKHNTEDSLWCIIDHRVYDLTDFLDAHPGGSVVLSQIAGKDATTDFYNLHRHEVLTKYRDSLCIGTIADEKPEVIDPTPDGLSPVPYAEPLWLRPGFKSPYYNESHRRLQKAIREFTSLHVAPEAAEKEKDGTYISQELIDKMAETNVLAMRLGPGKHLHGRKLLGGVVDGKEFDYLHDLIVAQEMVRVNARGKCTPIQAHPKSLLHFREKEC
jgi:predicted heme/steroid binding protein